MQPLCVVGKLFILTEYKFNTINLYPLVTNVTICKTNKVMENTKLATSQKQSWSYSWQQPIAYTYDKHGRHNYSQKKHCCN